MWFHIECLEAVPRGPFTSGPLIPKICFMPVMHGDLDSNHEWQVVGTGKKIEKVRCWVEWGALPDNWEERIGDHFLEFVESAHLFYYLCPECDVLI